MQGRGEASHCEHCNAFLPNWFDINLNLSTSKVGASQMNFSSEAKMDVKDHEVSIKVEFGL